MCAGSSTVPLNTRAVEARRVAIAARTTAARERPSSSDAPAQDTRGVERTRSERFCLRGRRDGRTFHRRAPHLFADGMDPSTIEIRPLDDARRSCKRASSSSSETWGEDFSDVVPPSILKVVTARRRRRPRRVRSRRTRCSDSSSDSPASSAGASSTGPTCSPCAPRRETSASAAGSRSSSDSSFASSAASSSTGRTIRSSLETRTSTSTGSACASRRVRRGHVRHHRQHAARRRFPTDRLVVAWPTRDDEIDESVAESRKRTLASLRLSTVAGRDVRMDRRRGGRGDSSALRSRRGPSRWRDVVVDQSRRSRPLAPVRSRRDAVGALVRLLGERISLGRRRVWGRRFLRPFPRRAGLRRQPMSVPNRSGFASPRSCAIAS